MRDVPKVCKLRHMATTQTLTVGEVARLYGISRRTIGRHIAAGDLVPVMKLPGRTGSYLLDAEQVVTIFGDARSSAA